MASRNLYVVLGTSPQASPETIRSAYRTLVKPDAEPLTPFRQRLAEPLRAEPLFRQSFELLHPSLQDEFFDWTVGHLTGRRVPKSGRRRSMDLEVVLSRDEAEHGGRLPIRIPILSLCPLCDGTGRDWFSQCRMCDGEGAVEGGTMLHLRVPPLVRDGTVWLIPVLDEGLNLRVQIRIDALGW
jgi:DnaJ-class molecular chaperone